MAPVNPVDEDPYNSSSDEDFAPSGPGLAADSGRSSPSSSSPSDEDREHSTARPLKRRKIRHPSAEAEALGYDNSGDEAIIKHDKTRKRKKHRREAEEDEDDDEGGEGGLIKTRAQRRLEVKERKPLVEARRAEVDVDALWARMAGPKGGERREEPSLEGGAQKLEEIISSPVAVGRSES